MGLRIGTNVQSLAAQRALGVNETAQRASLEKLASGSRSCRGRRGGIGDFGTRAATAVKQDIRNAQDGISVLQTAEGGMNEISNILVRFRELSIQAGLRHHRQP